MNSISIVNSDQDPSSPIEILRHIDDMNTDKTLLWTSATVHRGRHQVCQQSFNSKNYKIVKFLDTDLDERMMSEVEHAAMLYVIDLDSDEETPGVRKRRHSCSSCDLCKTSCSGQRVKDRSAKSNMDRFQKNYDGGGSGPVARYYSASSTTGSIPIKPVKPKIKKGYFTPPGTSYVPKPHNYRGCLW